MNNLYKVVVQYINWIKIVSLDQQGFDHQGKQNIQEFCFFNKIRFSAFKTVTFATTIHMFLSYRDKVKDKK